MQPESRRALVNTLVNLLPEQSSPVVISVKPEQPRPTPIRTNGTRRKTVSSGYDPSIVFLLELATIVSTRDGESVASMGQPVAEVLQNVVRDSGNIHPLALSRTAYYLLFMLEASQEHSFIRVPVMLHTISNYDQAILETAENELSLGLAICVQKQSPLKSEMTNTPDFWSILRSLHNRPNVAGRVFDILRSIVEPKPGAVTADNYEMAIALLNNFATAGSIGATMEQQRDKRSSEQRDRKAQKRDQSPRKAGKE